MAPKKSGGGGGGAKKKKVNTNRGFATVSIPRKKEEEPEPDVVSVAEADLAAVGGGVGGGAGGGENGAGEDRRGAVKEEWDPEAMEKHELELLAERIRPGSDKEAARMTKVMEYERRLAKTYPYYAWTEQDLQRRVLELALSSTEEDVPQPLDEPEDKVIARVATLWSILEQLGFRKARVDECLRTIKVLELEDALDWLFLHCDSDELLCEGPLLPPPPIEETIPLTPRPDREHRDREHPSPMSRSDSPSKPLRPELSDEAIEASLRARILSYDTPAEDTESGSGEDQGANAAYAAFKLQLSEVQRAQGAAKRALKGKAKEAVLEGDEAELMERQVALLKKKLKAVEGDYTFRKVDAEKLYREERVKLDAAQLAERLNGASVAEPVPDPAAVQVLGADPDSTSIPPSDAPDANTGSTPGTPNGDAASTTPTGGSETPASSTADKTGSTEESGGDSMFGSLLDEMPTEDLNDLGTTVPVRDMALPKHFSGKTPKTNLEETVRKADKYATVVFKRLGSTGSRAVRAAVTIRWDGGRTQTFEMQDAACWDQAQAFNYIATVALFAVSQTAVNKQLPLLFRDLWDELVAQKKEADDEAYCEQLKLFKTIAEPRLQASPSNDVKVIKAPTTMTADSQAAPAAQISPEASERIMQELAMRQQWPSYQEMLRQRAKLPIAAYRSFINSTIDSSQCVVLCGETGCGKSTQLPSFILEHDMRRGKPVKIYCTEPRRISAISLAQRVSAELGEAPGVCGTRNSLVGYSIRLDSRVSPSSKIVYATTGIVLRMLEGRESLADLTHIIIDEVHERNLDSDFLLIVLREILETRKDLKVILMSATVDADKIAAYMGGCPIITVPGRTFPVSSLYLEDVVELTRYRLDPSSESPYVARRMRTYGGRPRKGGDDDVPSDDDNDSQDVFSPAATATYSKQTRTTIDCMDHHAINYDLIISLLENLCFYKPELVRFSAAILIFMPSLESIRRLTDMLESHQAFGTVHFLILPLHSTISNENQGVVFNAPPPGVRKIVISTNLAETGVTIPDITAVIDTGMHREMRFDEKRQISRLVQTFVAQSNAAQRRGRAGRVQEGICFHLFTKQRHDTIMAEHPQPEMMRLSLQDLALRIKIMKIGNGIEDVLSKALDPPLAVNVQRAVASLIEAKALTTLEEITPLGRHLAKLPMDVHLGKFLIMACLFGCLDAALTITAALNSKTPWLTPFGREAEADAVKRSFKIENSDFMTTYNAYCSWREASGNGYEREFTRKSFLSQQNLAMMEELRQQYFSFLVDAGFIQVSEAEKRELISTRYGKSRTRFVRVPPELDALSRDPKTVMACLAASMYPKLLVVDPQSGQMRTLANSAPAAIHPSSVNFAPGRRVDFGNARFIVFFTAMHTKKLYVWESGSVDERAVYLLCGNGDFQLPAHSLVIDRKIKVHLEPKTVIAMKILRHRFNQLFNARMRNPSVTTDSQRQWLDLVVLALQGKATDVQKRIDPTPVKLSVGLKF